MKITKRKLDGGGWRIIANGEPTSLMILKGPPPKYRNPQEYDVCADFEEDTDWLFTAKSVGRAMETLALIHRELTR